MLDCWLVHLDMIVTWHALMCWRHGEKGHVIEHVGLTESLIGGERFIRWWSKLYLNVFRHHHHSRRFVLLIPVK